MATHEDFAGWLEARLVERGWKSADLARVAQLDTGMLSRILNRERPASADYCVAIADALGVPREDVFRARGYLRSRTNTGKRIGEIAEALDEEQRQTLLNVALALAGQPAAQEKTPTADEVEAYFRNLAAVERLKVLTDVFRQYYPSEALEVLQELEQERQVRERGAEEEGRVAAGTAKN